MTGEGPRQRGSGIGATGEVVGKQLKRVRELRELDLRGLAELLRANGRYISASALSKLENGTRRVDADDLIALAVALDTSPLSLLFDGATRPTTMPADITPDEVAAWARGDTHLDLHARINYWQQQADQLARGIEDLEAWQDRMHERPDSSPQVREMIAGQLTRAEQSLAEAVERITQLKATEDA